MPDRRILALSAVLFTACVVFLLWGLKGRVWFILELRSIKLLALLLVGSAIGVSTVMFQTVSGNRILTPSIMGFDALFLLLQTLLVLFLGGFGYAQLPSVITFLGETALMMAAAMLLFGMLLSRNRRDIQLMILVGVIFGLLFRSLTIFVQRLIDPSEFAMLQGAMFASFGAVNRTELLISAVICALVFGWVWRRISQFDVIALGRGSALSLGLPYDKIQIHVLAAIAALVSVSTALVGPITFLGLLAASFAHSLMRSHRHTLLIPAAALIAALVLVVGQTLFERIFRLQSTLAIMIEFFGGLLFLVMVAKGRIR